MTNGIVKREWWPIVKDIIQIVLVPAIIVVYHAITDNSKLLQDLKDRQLIVITTVSGLQAEFDDHILACEKDIADRARVHHTSNKNCIECKMPGHNIVPRQSKKLLLPPRGIE